MGVLRQDRVVGARRIQRIQTQCWLSSIVPDDLDSLNHEAVSVPEHEQEFPFAGFCFDVSISSRPPSDNSGSINDPLTRNTRTVSLSARQLPAHAMEHRLLQPLGAQGGSRTHTPRGHRNLNPACLPIPTPGRGMRFYPGRPALSANAMLAASDTRGCGGIGRRNGLGAFLSACLGKPDL